MEMNRRTFVKGGMLAGASAFALGLVGCSPAETGETESTETVSNDWLGNPPEIADDEISETIEVDALVCGLGTTGIFAAAKAASEGLKVLGIDHGTNTQIKSSVGSINNKYQAAAGLSYDKNEVLNDFERYSISGTDRRILSVWADRGAEAAEFYATYVEKCGIEVKANPTEPNPKSYYKPWPIELTTSGDVNFMEYRENLGKLPDVVLEDVRGNGADIRYNTALVKLTQDDQGAVTGAIIKLEDGSYAQVNASKGVILCTGGYASNEDMMLALQSETMQMVGNYQMTGTVAGDGIKAGLWAGGVLQDSHCSMVFDRAVLPPDCTGTYENAASGQYWAFASQPWLKVNLNGERFANESGLYESICRASINQPGDCHCVIFDADWQNQAPNFDTYGCSRFYPYPDNAAQSADSMELISTMMDGFLEDGSVVQADSISGLAEALGIPSETLEKTVERYNELAEAGVDEDFGKESYRMIALKTPPYYGFRCAGNLLCTLDGLLTTEKAEVIDVQGNPIPGLYAAGNDAGGFYTTCYPSLAIGLNAGRCITFGYVAAEELANR